MLRDEGVEHGAQVLAGADTQGQGLHAIVLHEGILRPSDAAL
jgi:hypothetical protein